MSIIEMADLKERVAFLEGKFNRMTRATIKLVAAVEKITNRLEVLEKEERVKQVKL